MEKVVKCGNKQCGLYFGYSEKRTTCPFCRTPYGKIEENIEEKAAERKVPIKKRKESFKIWEND